MTASAHAHPRVGAHAESPAAYQAFHILRAGFTIAPIIAGADKFTHLLVDWDKYVAPAVGRVVSPHTLMLAVGVVEIIAGLLVWVRPRIGGYVVMAWLWAIIVNLLMIPGYYDIALRDFGLSLGALALARLSREYSSH
jgi:hypothetical protein